MLYYVNVIFSELEENWTAEFLSQSDLRHTVLRTAVNPPEV